MSLTQTKVLQRINRGNGENI